MPQTIPQDLPELDMGQRAHNHAAHFIDGYFIDDCGACQKEAAAYYSTLSFMDKVRWHWGFFDVQSKPDCAACHAEP